MCALVLVTENMSVCDFGAIREASASAREDEWNLTHAVSRTATNLLGFDMCVCVCV